jgi:hypothetical protein
MCTKLHPSISSNQSPMPLLQPTAVKVFSAMQQQPARQAVCSTPPTAQASCQPVSQATAPRSSNCWHTFQTSNVSSKNYTPTGAPRPAPSPLGCQPGLQSHMLLHDAHRLCAAHTKRLCVVVLCCTVKSMHRT